MLVTLNRAISKMFKRVVLLLVLMMSVSFANANNEEDKKVNDSKIEKVESNKQLDVFLSMYKKVVVVKSIVVGDPEICTGTFYGIYYDGNSYYKATLPYDITHADGSIETMPASPPLPTNFDEINSICTSPGGSWES